ncbi:hypothetical protein Hanom_Chr10g00889861 [Helianthus anomalus]
MIKGLGCGESQQRWIFISYGVFYFNKNVLKDRVNELNENGKTSNLLDPDAEKQTFGRKSQNWPNIRNKNGILL